MNEKEEKKPTSQTLKKKEIIRGYLSFQEILSKGKKYYGYYINFFILPADDRTVGFIVSRKYKKAVHRNKIKRLMKEIYRKNKRNFPLGKIIFYAKYFDQLPSYQMFFEDIKKTLFNKNLNV